MKKDLITEDERTKAIEALGSAINFCEIHKSELPHHDYRDDIYEGTAEPIYVAIIQALRWGSKMILDKLSVDQKIKIMTKVHKVKANDHQINLSDVSSRVMPVKVGELLLISDNRLTESERCLVIKEVTKCDEKSFRAGDGIRGWWFYSDTLSPYAGDATIIGKIKS